ncbi:uncharacterized protein TRAVEDRAFT_138986 [Trametes versicolor FP-101664 SS1]|uniref:uncharacterized protein n=1 Tax=Trametes versicolor (strain FP-101664) TaxID=717944 RepID=UPI00046236D9|nr:uncharacterized protein TRAVEDRAFT_138986 [Trametes versicolor FP-101664 SS1]EIW64317.1 hypothetical protein TRAVEDRAFT_138986 [Trametes versicolor FP-101664 SS1]
MLAPSNPLGRRDTQERGRYSHISTDAFSDDNYRDGAHRHAPRWTLLYAAPVGVYKASVTKFGRRRGPAMLGACVLVLVLTALAFHGRFVSAKRSWPLLGATSTVVFERDQLRKIWEWEILSGHYPSTRAIPDVIGFTSAPSNPALPSSAALKYPTASDGGVVTYTVGTGAERIYPEVKNRQPEFGHPPRPIPGSVADLDIILENCDFETGKYVRDCHEILRLGAGLDNAVRLRREDVEYLRYIYVLDGEGDHITPRSVNTATLDAPPSKRASYDWEHDLPLPPHSQYNPANRQSSPCPEDDPRIFHMFWAGPFTDKPYMAMMAFLYTQNLGLHRENPASENTICRPQLWLWVSRGPADTMPSETADEEMHEELRSNPWAAPFLHPRFKDVIQFRLWNTSEQLDSIDELRDDWRSMSDELLSSVKDDATKSVGSNVALDGKSNETFATYNKLPVVLSDLVRFVLCHRYGGVYLDVDMLFLRDWEELWGWTGAFSYRWSHEDRYNTAVLRLRRGSALGTFLLRTALRNGLDFHPTTVSRYLKEAHMERLLFRVPDALFDPAWLNTDHRKPHPWSSIEYLQRDRPAQPFFTDFDNFFNTPPETSAMPAVVGFDGFFRGAYMYHYHNEWWKPVDAARFWPDLGPRFADVEKMGRAAIEGKATNFPVGIVHKDKRDLDWATVLKRTFEAYVRGERPNMYGEWIRW